MDWQSLIIPTCLEYVERGTRELKIFIGLMKDSMGSIYANLLFVKAINLFFFQNKDSVRPLGIFFNK